MNSHPETGIKVENSSRVIYSSLLFFSVCAFFLWLADTQIIESLLISAVIGVQVFSGSYIWSQISTNHKSNPPILIGIGLALGSSLSIFSQQFLRTSSFGKMAWALPAILCLTYFVAKEALFRSGREYARESFKRIKSPKDFDLLLWGAVAFLLSTRWLWIFPLTVILILSALCGCLFRSWFSKCKTRILTGLLILGSIQVSLIFRNRSNGWFHFSHDQTFSESLAWSLARFGPNESPFEVGVPTRYHWLALAWSGITATASNASALTLITKALPIASFIGIIALIWGVTESISRRRQTPIIAIFGFALLWNLAELSPPLYTNSPTFLFTCVWFLASIFVVIQLQQKFSTLGLFVFIMLAFATIGGKASTGVVLIMGILFGACVGIFRQKSKTGTIKSLLLPVVSALVLLISYLFFYFDNSGRAVQQLWIQIGASGPASGISFSQNNVLFNGLSSGFLLLDLLMPNLVIFLLIKIKKPEEKESYFFLGILATGYLASFLLNASGGSQLYFYLAAACITPIIVALYLEKANWHFAESSNIWIICTGFISTMISSTAWSSSSANSNLTNSAIVKIGAISFPWLTAIILRHFLVFLSKGQSGKKRTAPTLASIILIISVCSSYRLIYQYRNTERQINQIQVDQTNDSMSGSTDQLAIFDWLRTNTADLDIVATNRFCISYDSNCYSKWMLLSAISHRRAYIEGGYFDWLTKNRIPSVIQQSKIDSCISFAVSPNFENWSSLAASNVSWFIVDHVASPPLQTWEPFATIVMTNPSMTLLKVNQGLTR